MFRFFTAEEANSLLPDIIQRFETILRIKSNILKIQDELQKITDSEYMFEKFITKKQELNSQVSLLYTSIQNLEDLGILIKSVDEGLLDFPSIRKNEEILLCWKYGEKDIKFWHGKDEGFMGRKPIPAKGFTHTVDDFSDLR